VIKNTVKSQLHVAENSAQKKDTKTGTQTREGSQRSRSGLLSKNLWLDSGRIEGQEGMEGASNSARSEERTTRVLQSLCSYVGLFPEGLFWGQSIRESFNCFKMQLRRE